MILISYGMSGTINMGLSESHRHRLQQVITSLLDRNFDTDNDGCVSFQDSRTEQECRAVWKDWHDLYLDVQKVNEERMKFNDHFFTSADHEDICEHLMNRLTLAVCSKDLDSLRGSNEEVRHWSMEFSTTDDIDCINPTLIHPFVHKWKIDYHAFPFEGYMPCTKADIQKCKSLTALCKETLTLWVKHFQQFKQLHPIKVIMWNSDGLCLCTSGLPSDMSFDAIDTSNVSDHIGLLNVLVCCAPRLKRPRESQLQTSSMLWWEGRCEDIEDYYNMCIGINTNLLPTILGLHLAVDLDLGNRRIPDDWEETLYWVKASTHRTRLTIDKESDVITGLWNLTKRCFNLNKDLDESCGATLSSPLTLLRIIHHMHPLIEGGASRIMDLLENELPYDFYQEHGFFWKLLKSAATHDGEPILQIQVQLRLNIAEGNQQCPIPMIVFLDNAFLDLFDCFQGCPVLYNSLRFNVQEGHVTFHMLEKDWEIAKVRFLLHVLDNQKLPVFLSKPVPLRDDSLFDVQRVDPVATFGLFAVQEFNICDSSSPLLKLLKVQEEDDSYKVEFAIIDPVKCIAKDMTIQFTPESSPTEIKLNFQRETGSTLRFSCPVKASSKFQLSKKQASVVCQIIKQDNFVSGEMALINPSQVPFHAMSLWDPKQDDIEWTCSKMYRGNLPKLMAQKDMGHPFFELTCLIVNTLQKQINQQNPTIYEISLDMCEGNWNKGLIIKVLSPVYKWNNLPYAKCTFYDKNHAGDDPTKVMQLLFREFFGCSLNVITKQEPEIEMIRRMMYINAARTDQKNAMTSLWTDSFICPLYARETLLNFPETVFDEMRDLFRNATGTGQTTDEQREDKTPNTDKHDCCAFCLTPTGNLKKCTRCKKVSYCNQDCQAQHWKNKHKDECLAGSSYEEIPSQQGQLPGRLTKVPRSPNAETNKPFPSQQGQLPGRTKVPKSPINAETDKPSQQKEPEARNKVLEPVPNIETNELDHCAFCQKPSENLKKCTKCGKVAYCNRGCQTQHWKKEHKDVCSKLCLPQLPSKQDSSFGYGINQKDMKCSERKPRTLIDRCASCLTPSGKLKKCTRCKKVSYCNQDCQAQHWKNKNKDECLAGSSYEEIPSQQGQLPGRLTKVPRSPNAETNKPFPSQQGQLPGRTKVPKSSINAETNKPSQQKEPEARNKVLEPVPNIETNELDHCAFCHKPSENLKKCTRCGKVAYCNRDCQTQHWKKEHKDVCSTLCLPHLPSKQDSSFGYGINQKDMKCPERKPCTLIDRCAFCRKPSEDLKKCTRCKKVSYCSQDCQAQHWKKEHKSNCPSSSLEQVPSENKDSFGVRSDALDRCAFCHKASEDLKKVFYCNRDCQEKHWKKELKSVCACGQLQ